MICHKQINSFSPVRDNLVLQHCKMITFLKFLVKVTLLKLYSKTNEELLNPLKDFVTMIACYLTEK